MRAENAVKTDSQRTPLYRSPPSMRMLGAETTTSTAIGSKASIEPIGWSAGTAGLEPPAQSIARR